jgi:hypothetical protein
LDTGFGVNPVSHKTLLEQVPWYISIQVSFRVQIVKFSPSLLIIITMNDIHKDLPNTQIYWIEIATTPRFCGVA